MDAVLFVMWGLLSFGLGCIFGGCWMWMHLKCLEAERQFEQKQRELSTSIARGCRPETR